jgi:uncharacterized membrane protein YfcA
MSLLSDPLFLAAAVLAVTFLGISKGGFIGLGVTAVPLLSLFVPPQQAAAILLPILVTQDIVSVVVYRRDFSAWNLKAMVPGAACGAVIATFAAVAMPVDAVRLIVGTIALGFVALRLSEHWVEQHLPKPGAVSGVFWGVVSGFASTLANAGSPPMQIHLLPQQLPKLTFVGTTTLFFASINIMKLPSYIALHQITAENMTAGFALVPLAIATNFFGVWLVHRVSPKAFYRIAYALMLILGIVLIRSAVLDLAWF